MHTWTYIHTHTPQVHTHSHKYTHTHTSTHTHAHTSTHTLTHSHSHKYTHTHTGELMKYDNGWWGEVAPGDGLKLTKTEGQVGLSLYHLLLHQDCQQKYEFNSHNKSVILKVSTAMGNLTF